MNTIETQFSPFFWVDETPPVHVGVYELSDSRVMDVDTDEIVHFGYSRWDGAHWATPRETVDDAALAPALPTGPQPYNMLWRGLANPT